MAQKRYKVSYLPIFYDDLLKAINYITLKLKNERAAEELINLTEMVIRERLNAPESFEKYQSMKERKYPYYRIYVKNYIIFYVVIPDKIDSSIATMEIRRFIYNRRDFNSEL
jgi:plasmid stabilization system protein ParE